MRQVIRTSEPDCLNVTNIPHAAIEAVRNTGRAKPIYRKNEVTSALKNMYLDKCFLCEKKLGDGEWDVDHFIAYHRTTPHLAYTWSNLQWCCKRCNQRKKNYAFRKFNDDGADVATLLVDPSNPTPLSVRQMIRFSARLKAIAGNESVTSDEVVLQTIEFLNAPAIVDERNDTRDAIDQFLLGRECPHVEWGKVISSKNFDIESWEGALFEAFKDAHDLWETFLDARATHSASMRDYMLSKYKISHLDIKRMGEAYRDKYSVPFFYRDD